MVDRDPNSPLSRKDFLRLSLAFGGAATLAALLDGCSKAVIIQESLVPPTRTLGIPTSTPALVASAEASPIPSATLTEPVPSGMAQLAFVKTSSRAEGVRKAIDLLETNPVQGKKVFLKPNFNSADPTPGSTHPDVLRALVEKLKEMGAGKITVGDRSGMGNTRRVMEQIGVFRLAELLDFEAVVFDELRAEDWVLVKPPASHWENGFPFARPCLEAGAIVQTCCLKTHRYGGHFTLSLKNSVGMVAKQLPQEGHNFMQELHSSNHQRRMIAEINTAYTPALVVLDGVEALVSGGPDKGELVSPGVVIAGTDRVALDAVGVALLRFYGCKTEAGQGKIFAQEQIARAVELGLGVDRPDKIELITGDGESEAYAQQIMEVLMGG